MIFFFSFNESNYFCWNRTTPLMLKWKHYICTTYITNYDTYFQAAPPHLSPHFQREPQNHLRLLSIKVTNKILLWIVGVTLKKKKKAIKLIVFVQLSAPVEQKLEVPSAVNLSRIGMSSEWCGNTKPAAAASQNEMKPWLRSRVRIKSLPADVWLTCDFER